MGWLKNKRFRKLRRKLKNQLRKITDNPSEYVNKVNKLTKLYDMYVKEDFDERSKMIDGYLISKGLLSTGEIEEQVKAREEIKEDNKYVKEMKTKFEDMNNKLIEIQEYVILNIEEMKKTRTLVQKKIRTLTQLSDTKRNRKITKHIM